MTERDATIQHCRDLVDTYMDGALSVDKLIELRRELAGYNMRLSAFVKPTYIRRGQSYVQKKHAIARDMYAAYLRDVKANGKAVIGAIEIEATATAHAQDLANKQVAAEAEWEELEAVKFAVKEALAALSQEIAYERQEKATTHHQSQGA